MKSLTVLAFLTMAMADIQARPSNTVWTVTYVVAPTTNSTQASDAALVGKTLDTIASDFHLKPITPDRTDVVRIYSMHSDLMLALDAVSESNGIAVHATPMMPRLKMTDEHRRFFAQLEAALNDAFKERLRKEE